jgi:wee1-like protein kinase
MASESFEECKRTVARLLTQTHSPSNPNTPTLKSSIPSLSYYSRWKISDRLFEGVYNASGHSTPKTPATLIDPKKFLHFRDNSGSFIRQNSSDFLSFIEDADLASFTPPLSHKNSMIESVEDSSGRYEHDFAQLNVLGSGEFGIVFKCINKIDGFYYAVKQLRINNKSLKSEAVQEAYILASSSMIDDNSYVIRYYSVWTEHSSLFICMELCECSLSKYVESHPVTEELIVKVLRNILKGLKKLHENHIVHMDIKPENILMSKYGRFKLADLGLARITTGLIDEVPEGDCRYLASEVLEEVTAEHIPDLTKADIFSLGASVLELMKGTSLPKNGQDWLDIRSGNFMIPNGFSFKLRENVRKMLAREPETRPSAEFLLEHVFISKKQEELLKWKNYAKMIERKQLENPVKRRKLSL